jgi:hypothetical protein
MPVGIGFGKIAIQGKQYNIAPKPDSYNVSESPAHSDIDQKMERRVIYRTFSGGISKRREEPSLDATMASSTSFSLLRQVKNTTGIYWANGGDTRSEDRIFVQRANVASNFADLVQQPFQVGDASVYSFAASQNAVYALQTPPGTWIQSTTTTPTVTDITQYGGQVYLAVGDANSFYTWNQATVSTTWTQRTFQAGHFAVIRNQLWRSVGASVFSTTNTDPANQVWSTATVVGDPNTNITDMDVWQDFLMIFKQDGIYNIDKTGSVYNLFPGFKNLGTNPRPIGQWRDSYYLAADVGLIWEVSKRGVKRIGFDVSEPFPMGGVPGTTIPTYSLPNVMSNLHSRGVPTTNFLVVGFNEYSADSESGAYFLAWDGITWHPFAFFQRSVALAVGLTGGNQTPVNPVLQFGVQSRSTGTNQIFYQTTPLVDPFLATSFDTNPQVVYLNVDNGALEDEYKVLERINIGLDNYRFGICQMAYALDEGIVSLNFQDMGPPQGNLTQVSQQFNPPQPFPTYRKIQLRITLTANNSTISPILRYIVLHYKQRTPQRKVWDVEILADQNIVGSQGRVDVRNSSTIVGDLDTARQNHTQVEFIDIRNQSHTVYVDEVGEKIVNLKGDLSPSFIVTVKLVETSLEEVVNTQ